MKLSKSGREQLRMLFGGFCAYCGCELPEKGWHADHVEAVHREWWKTAKWKKSHAVVHNWDEAKRKMVERQATEEELTAKLERPENDKPENLVPSCSACNLDKHAQSLEGWREMIADKAEVCRRNYSAFRHAERFGLVQEIKKPVVFWFEKYAPTEAESFEVGTCADASTESQTQM